MSINVNIIEGDYNIVPPEVFDEICEDWNKGVPKNKISKKYEVTPNRLRRLIPKIIEATGYDRKDPPVPQRRVKENCKYYYYFNNRYFVRKSIDGVTHNFGSYASEKMAQEAVRLFKECDWDTSQKGRIYNEVMDYGR